MRERLLVYAVVSGTPVPPGSRGVAGEPLRRMRVAGLDVVAGRISHPPRPSAASMRRYDAMLRALTAHGGAVVPARFGTCVASARELEVLVRARLPALRRALRLVRRRVQMTTRVAGASTPAPRRPAAPASSGTEYLRRRARELDIPEFAPLRAAVRRWVRAERVEPQARGVLRGTVYHLVPRAAVAPYRRALEQAAAASGVRIVTTGPWPPYAFTE